MSRVRATLLCLVLVSMTACASTGGESGRGDVLGTWGDPAGVATAHVILTDDGRLAGSDGCNRMMGQWQFDSGVVTFGAVATTRMYCEGVDTSINQMRTARLVEGEMRFYDEHDTLIATLERGD